MPQRRAAVLGSPIAHSLSPALHRAAYAAMGLTGWSYEAIECDEAGLPALLDGLDASWAGLSLTMPLKRAAIPLADTVSELALAVGSVNTLVLRDGRRHGDNTDVYGIVAALAEADLKAPGSGLVLGGGATAASALAALRELGLAAATLLVREPARATEAGAAGERLGMAVRVLPLDELPALLARPPDGRAGPPLVISTLPGHAADRYAGPVAASGAAVLDVVYAPWPTALGAAVRRAGGTVVGGLPMLLHQAGRQVELMTGRRRVPVAAMRAAGEAELDRRRRDPA